MSFALICPGQGGQTATTHTELLADPLLACPASELMDLLPQTMLDAMANPQTCMANPVAQPLVVLHGIAVCSALAQAGLEPDCVAGYSVGEVSAQFACGGLSARATLELAVERGRLMSEQAQPDCGLMAVTQVRIEQLEPACHAHGCYLAIVNGGDHAVVAGSKADLVGLKEALSLFQGAVTRELPVTVASHSPLMGQSGHLMAQWLQGQHWTTARCALVSGLNGHLLYNPARRMDSLVQQMTHTVQWHRAMQSLTESGCKVVLEIGPGNALSRMMGTAYPDLAVRSVSDFSNMLGAINWIKAQVDRV